MNDDKEDLKEQLESYLATVGIDTRRPFRCLNPEHEDKHPSMTFYREGRVVKCFSCGVSYDLFDVIGIVEGKDKKHSFERARELYGIGRDAKTAAKPTPIKKVAAGRSHLPADDVDYTEFYKQAHADINLTDYPQRRGLSERITNKFNLGFVKKWKHPKAPNLKGTPADVLIIPINQSAYIARAVNPGDRWAVGSGIFNKEKLNSDVPVFITEAAIDAMSIEEIGGVAVSINSTGMINRFIETLNIYRPNVAIIAMDSDKAGQNDAATPIHKELTARKIPCVNITNWGKDATGTPYKDANESLKGGALMDIVTKSINEVKAIAESAGPEANQADETPEQYRARHSYAAHVDTFFEESRRAGDAPTLSTGFLGLDKKLGGGLFEGLYTFGAMTGAGKTTFALQITASIARQERDVIYFGLEMNRRELQAKHLSRETALINYSDTAGIDATTARTTRDFLTLHNAAGQPLLTGRTGEIMMAANEEFKKYAPYIFPYGRADRVHTAADIKAATAAHYRHTQTAPVIIVDYLQYIRGNEGATDKQRVTGAVETLKAIADGEATGGNQTTVICISSINRASYDKAIRSDTINFESFKESGEIEYTSEVLLGMTEETEEIDGKRQPKTINVKGLESKHTRQINVSILKQRYGDRDETQSFLFVPMYNLFDEI